VSETGPEPLIRVLLLIENRLLRESLGRIFRKRADFLVVGSHGNEDSSLEKVFETQCDQVDAVSRSQAVEAIRSHGYSLDSYGGTA
jgi:hypothetical protein